MQKKKPFRTYLGCYEGTGWIIIEPLSKTQIKKADKEFYDNPVQHLKNPHSSTGFNIEKKKFNEYYNELLDYTIDELQEAERYCDLKIIELSEIDNGNFAKVSLVFAFAAITISILGILTPLSKSDTTGLFVMEFLKLTNNQTMEIVLDYIVRIIAPLFFIVIICAVLYCIFNSANNRVRKNKSKLLLFHSAIKDVINEKREQSV